MRRRRRAPPIPESAEHERRGGAGDQRAGDQRVGAAVETACGDAAERTADHAEQEGQRTDGAGRAERHVEVSRQQRHDPVADDDAEREGGGVHGPEPRGGRRAEQGPQRRRDVLAAVARVAAAGTLPARARPRRRRARRRRRPSSRARPRAAGRSPSRGPRPRGRCRRTGPGRARSCRVGRRRSRPSPRRSLRRPRSRSASAGRGRRRCPERAAAGRSPAPRARSRRARRGGRRSGRSPGRPGS